MSPSEIQRREQRIEIKKKAYWDFFGEGTGLKMGTIADLSLNGCLLHTTHPIQINRWLRLIIEGEESHLYLIAVGRVVHEKKLASVVNGTSVTASFDYGIEFTYPNYFSLAGTDFILALSNKN